MGDPHGDHGEAIASNACSRRQEGRFRSKTNGPWASPPGTVLPLQIRRKVDPHYSQWYVVPAREAQCCRPSESLSSLATPAVGGRKPPIRTWRSRAKK